MWWFLLAEGFGKKASELLNNDSDFNFMGLKQMAQFWTQAGVSSLTSCVAFTSPLNEDDLSQIPDYILSDTLEKDLDASITVCVFGLKESKYLPSTVVVGSIIGAVADGQREGAYLKQWQDYEILGVDGNPVYTEEMVSVAEAAGEHPLSTAFWLIVKDICDDGGMLSPEWYRARIILEYFKEYPIPPENAFLIGELFKELCVKEQYEGELAAYYAGLAASKDQRRKGTSTTKEKAEELRNYCLNLFVEIAESVGPRIMFAPAEVQAHELRKVALEKRPDDFVRAGKPYSVQWFLRHVIEDRKIEIVETLEKRLAEKASASLSKNT